MELIDARKLGEAHLAATEAIYADRFPDGLRSPFADLLADETLVLVDGGRPVGFTVSRRLGGTGWVFLRYFAVGTSGAGTGSRMWRLACAHWAAAGLGRVLLDVEDPDEPGLPDEEAALHRRRIVFYERLGARVVPVRDFCPPQADGHPHPLRLVTAATGEEQTMPPVRDLVVAAYRFRYGLDPDDPIVRRTLDSITGG